MAFIAACWWSVTASAQLDPLLFLKRVPPTVIVAFDNSFAMMEDGAGNTYDTNTYSVADDLAAAAAMGIDTALATAYRRKYVNLQYDALQGPGNKWTTETIVGVPNTSPDYSSFWNNTRFETARQGLTIAINQNSSSTFRWGLVKQRQDTPAWRVSPKCDKPVNVTGGTDMLRNASDANPCAAGGVGRYAIYAPYVANPNYGIETAPSPIAVVAANGGSSSSVLAQLTPWKADGAPAPASYSMVTGGAGIIPASKGANGYRDRPLQHLLEDAKSEAQRAMTADNASTRSCRNTVVVLIASGPESGDATYMNNHNAASYASSFLNVSASGVTKRVPIVVIGVKVNSTDANALSQIATNSGGWYVAANSAADIAAAVNRAVQAGFARQADFDSSTASEFIGVSPVVGTVNLIAARDAAGNSLPDTDIVASPGGQPLPQRSNTMLTAGFGLPGFDGRLRAFRTYKPVPDSTKPTGWKFVHDGTRLWPDLDGRPQLAGMARTPADPNARNIYTYLPDGSGGGSVVAFTAANAAALAPHMNAGSDPGGLINFIRSQPLGAVVGSTPALMDPPSLDPPPDDQYGRPDAADSFAGRHKTRRSIIFVGANDGMFHALDARTGYEVWAFIPYNLLPKLRALQNGQPVEQFNYFVDSSPKIAEVKIANEWRSVVIIGEGPGGVFYQAFDVTDAGMGVDPAQGDASAVSALLRQFDLPDESIRFKWAFPNYNSFNTSYTGTFTGLSDATPGGKITLYGDLKSTASYAEKTVGFAWSDPAVGTLDRDRAITAVMLGSGYFPDVEASLPGRGASAPKAGNAIYLLNVDTGQLIGNQTGGACAAIGDGSGSATGCAVIGDASNGRKNAIQADPTAAGDGGSYVVDRAYVGDIDGKYWRFNFTSGGQITANLMLDTGDPIYASSALLFIGSMDVYMFFATGSDLLPGSAPGGTGTFKLYGLKDNYPGSGSTTKFTIKLAQVSASEATGLTTGERPSTAPSVAGDIVFYTTTSEDASTPCADFSAKLYALTYVGGAAYDSNNNGRVDNNESPVAKTVSGRATAPFIVDQHLYFGSAGASGANVEAFGDPEDFNNGIGQVGVRILSWREIR